MFPQTIFILVIYFLSTLRMSLGQTYPSGKGLVSFELFIEGKVGLIITLHSVKIMNMVCILRVNSFLGLPLLMVQ